MLFLRSTQPPSHAVVPVGHPVFTHAPAEQTSPVAHALPHAPQFAPSVVVSTQSVPQRVLPGAQPHLPAMQTSTVSHATPQSPQ